jgi:N-acetylglucosaminyl-diphospho-decaprenol L-rhamnosyltransferase
VIKAAVPNHPSSVARAGIARRASRAVPAIVGFDAAALGREGADATFVAEVLGALGQLDLPFRILAYVTDPDAVPATATEHAAVVPVRIAGGSAFVPRRVALAARLRTDQPSLYQASGVLPRAIPCPGVVVVHDCTLAECLTPQGGAGATLRRAVLRSVLRGQRVVTTSDRTRDALLERVPSLDPARVVAIPAGVSQRATRETGTAALAHAGHGLGSGYFLFLGGGRSEDEVRRVLEAWALVKAARPGPELLVVAEWPARKASDVDRAAAGLGIGAWVRRVTAAAGEGDHATLLAGARGVVLLPPDDGLGRQALESMACGTPVVVPSRAAPQGPASGAVLRVPTAEPTSVASALERLLADDGEHARLRAEGLRCAREVTWTRTADRLAQVYEDVLAETRPARRVGPTIPRTPPVEVVASIVSTGEADRLRPCVESLAAQGLGPRLRVVVVCNLAGDGSAELVRNAFPDAMVVEQPRPRGFAENHNTGLRIAASEFGLVLNPDVVLEPGCLPALLDLMRARPRCGIAAPLLVYPDGTPQASARRFPNVAGTLLRRTPLRRILPPARFNRRHYLAAPAGPRPVQWALGACLLFRRTAWQDLGGFDQVAFPHLYVEDIEIAWRAWQRGWEVWQTPSARARHDHQAATDGAFFQRRTLWHLQGMREFVRKHPTVLLGLRPALADSRAAGGGERCSPDGGE